MPKKSKRKLISAFEAAECLGISIKRVWAYARRGVLESKRFGRTVLIYEDSLLNAAQVKIGRPPGSKNEVQAEGDTPVAADHPGVGDLSRAVRYLSAQISNPDCLPVSREQFRQMTIRECVMALKSAMANSCCSGFMPD